MPSIRLTQFAGLMPELSAKLKRKDNAQIAHNCLLYDGRLRAMPAYYRYNNLSDIPLSLFRANIGLGRVIPDYDIVDAQSFTTPPLPVGTFGIGTNFPNYIAGRYGPPGSGVIVPAALDPPIASSVTIDVTTNNHLSPRPSCVSYAITSCRVTPNSIEESTPLFLGTVGGLIGPNWHEGDFVTIAVTLLPFVSGQNAIRLYRTVTAIESGEELINTFDTEWHIIETVTSPTGGGDFNFVDGTFTQNLQGDVLLSKTFFCPNFKYLPHKFGITESGWVYYTSQHEIQFAERYLPHAWPIFGYVQIPLADEIIDSKPFYDTVFLGTSGRPYKVNISPSDDDAVNILTAPYPEAQPCIAETMVTAPFGALYTSRSGIVSLTEDKMQVMTRDLLNGGDILYRQCVDGVEQDFHFADISKAAWFNGWYIGYTADGKIFVYDAPEDLNDEHAFQQLVTMDAPVSDSAPGPWAIGDYGLQIAFGQDLYYWPVPGWVRAMDVVQKLCYRWKSKKFVFPGKTAFAAAKVVWECDGEVCFKLIGDCQVVYQRTITNCLPFRLPHNHTHIEWEIELTGTGTVSEVHVATSMQELTEVNTE